MKKIDVFDCYEAGLEKAALKGIALGADTDLYGPEMDELRGLVWREIKQAFDPMAEGLDESDYWSELAESLKRECNRALVNPNLDRFGGDRWALRHWVRRVVIIDRLHSTADAKARELGGAA